MNPTQMHVLGFYRCWKADKSKRRVRIRHSSGQFTCNRALCNALISDIITSSFWPFSSVRFLAWCKWRRTIMGHRRRHCFDWWDDHILLLSWLCHRSELCLIPIFISDSAASCDLFLFLSGGNFSIDDGRVIVEPPSDSLDAIAAPRHFVALDYLYSPRPVAWHLFFLTFGPADITQTYRLFSTMYFSTSAGWRVCILIWESGVEVLLC